MSEKPRRQEGPSILIDKKKEERALDSAQCLNIPPAQKHFDTFGCLTGKIDSIF